MCHCKVSVASLLPPETPESHKKMICDKNHMHTKASIFTQPECSGDEGLKGSVYNRCSCSLLAHSRCLWSLQRRGVAKVLWMDNRTGVGGAAGGECAVQWSSSEDAQTLCLMISIFTRCLQVSFPSSWTPKDLFHLHTFPVCHFGSIGFLFLSLPKARCISFHFPGTTTISFCYI